MKEKRGGGERKEGTERDDEWEKNSDVKIQSPLISMFEVLKMRYHD
jgi:hypothetical protein